MLSKKIFDDLTKDCPCHKHGCGEEWCFPRAYMEASEERMMMQTRLVVDYQWDRAKTNGRMGLGESYKKFVEEGYATKFGENYKDGMTREELFPLVFGYDIQMPTDAEIEAHLASKPIKYVK